jgi:TonB family protein
MSASHSLDPKSMTAPVGLFHPAPSNPPGTDQDQRIGPMLVSVLWLGCVTVGLLGMAFSYPRPHPTARTPPAILARELDVEIASVSLAPEALVLASDAPADPAPAPTPPVIPQPAPLLAVAAPSPAIAFPLPVDGPTRVVEPAQAAYVRPPPVVPAPPTPPPVQPLTLGLGEGKQPAPEYPHAAIRAGQEGTVRVALTVGNDGRVLAAETVVPSPWSLLNEAALGTVRKRWRFAPGPVRRYEVPIRFELKK